ncbi:MAG: phosphodiester glycosidase family protein [Bacilli bacterium]
MKKLTFILCFIFVVLFFVFFRVNTFAHSMSVEKNDTIKSGTVIPGITYESFSGMTINDAQTTSNQRISWVKKSASAHAKIVSWSKLKENGIEGANLLNLASDFESKNPGWRVLAGINGDYYDPTTKTPVNALVQQGDVVKGTNFTLSRYFSIGFNDDSTGYVTSKTNVLETKYALTIYDESRTRVILEVELQGLNTYPNSKQTSVYYNSQYPYQIPNARYFRVNDLDYAINYGSYLFKGKVNEEVNNTETHLGQLVIASLDERVQYLLEKNPYIRVQKHLKDVNNGYDNIIGVGSQPLKDGTILEFSEINDQNLDFAKLRAPRSSIGFTHDGSFVMATMDGRQSLMAGVDLREEAMVMASLGCHQAFNLDGGGSTQLIVRENDQLVMLNSPSEIYRNNANGVLIVEPDVDIEVDISHLSFSSLDLQYSLVPQTGVNIISHSLYANNVPITTSPETITIDSLIYSGINYLSLVVKYEKQGFIYERCLWVERINLANYGLVEPIVKEKPHDFTVVFEKDETIKGFTAVINFDDPDNTITKLYLAYEGNEEIALKRINGYEVDFYNVENNSSFSFSIIYYYRINTINAVSETYETLFPYVYQAETEPEPEPEPEPKPEPETKGCLSWETLLPISLLMLGFGWFKRRKHE